MGKVKVDKSEIFITYHINGDPRLEYIPPEISKLEKNIRDKYLRFLDRIGAPTYYWHYRHMLGTSLCKIEDIKFLIHVYENHDFEPTDKVEKRHFNKAWRLYGLEFNTLIRPKLDQEKVGHGVIHEYALAYYRRWLKPINPNFTRLYHGVDMFEMIEMYDEILKNMKKDMDSTKNKLQYYDAKARLNVKSRPAERKKTPKKINEEKEARITAYKEFRTSYWAVDFIICYLGFVASFQIGSVDRPFTDDFFIFIGYSAVLQLIFIPAFYAIKFIKYQDIK